LAAAACIHSGQLLAAAPPFWGHQGSKRQLSADQQFRLTELALIERGLQPKSVFQLGGAGAVGTGSLRGMRHLLQLQAAGFRHLAVRGGPAGPA